MIAEKRISRPENGSLSLNTKQHLKV